MEKCQNKECDNEVMEYFDKCEDCLIEESKQIEFEEQFKTSVNMEIN